MENPREFNKKNYLPVKLIDDNQLMNNLSNQKQKPNKVIKNNKISAENENENELLLSVSYINEKNKYLNKSLSFGKALKNNFKTYESDSNEEAGKGYENSKETDKYDKIFKEVRNYFLKHNPLMSEENRDDDKLKAAKNSSEYIFHNIKNILKNYNRQQNQFSSSKNLTRKINDGIIDFKYFNKKEAQKKKEKKNNHLNKYHIDNNNNYLKILNFNHYEENKDNIIGPNPNIKIYRRNFSFNKSYDSLDVQSEFFISYLKDEEKDITENSCLENGNSGEESLNNYENQEENQDNKHKNINVKKPRTNLISGRNKPNEEEVSNFNQSKQMKSSNKNKYFIDNKNSLRGKSETGKSSNNHNINNLEPNNNNNYNNPNCCFFRCWTITNHNLNKQRKRNKQDAIFNSYFSTINNTKRSTNHSFKSIKLNDSLTKLRNKKRTSICITDSKIPKLNTITTVSSAISTQNLTYKKDKKVNCRCEIF